MVDSHDQSTGNHVLNPVPEEFTRKKTRQNQNNAATGASAASIRALSAQFVTFYFRAPVKAFFKTRIDYMGFARAINPRVQANEPWSWRISSPGLLVHAVRQYGWTFIPKQVLPPMLANVTIGAVLYTSYLQVLGGLHDQSGHNTKRSNPPPPISATFTAGFAAGSIQSLVAAPLDALQVRFKTSEMLEGQYNNMWHYARNKLREIGAKGVFAGWGLSLVKDSFGNALFFATFETIKSQGYYAFLTRYYGKFKPMVLQDEIAEKQRTGSHQRPEIRPHYALEPTFLLLAGVTASIAQQLVQYPITLIQDIHYGRLESIDYAAKMEKPQEAMSSTYYRAYQTTIEQCREQAMKAGGWRHWLFKDFFRNTIRQVPSTSAGLIVFELVRRKYASDDVMVRIEKDEFDILLT